MRLLNAPDELPAQEPLGQIARLLAAGVLRLHKRGSRLAEVSKPAAEPAPESGEKALSFPTKRGSVKVLANGFERPKTRRTTWH